MDSSELLHGRVYRLNGEYLTTGVWDDERRGYVGIKHDASADRLYLEYDIRYGGTAMATVALDAYLPADLPLSEFLGLRCDDHDEEVDYNGRINEPGYWFHTSNGMRCTSTRTVLRNETLHRFLAELEA
jgi:hypothetical protein